MITMKILQARLALFNRLYGCSWSLEGAYGGWRLTGLEAITTGFLKPRDIMLALDGAFAALKETNMPKGTHAIRAAKLSQTPGGASIAAPILVKVDEYGEQFVVAYSTYPGFEPGYCTVEWDGNGEQFEEAIIRPDQPLLDLAHVATPSYLLSALEDVFEEMK